MRRQPLLPIALVLLLSATVGCNRSTSEPTQSSEAASTSTNERTALRGEPIRPRASDQVAATNAVTATNAIAATPVNTNNPAALQKDGEHTVVGFEYLASFNYVMPDESAGPSSTPTNQIPDHIRALDQKPIALKGFMLPLKVEAGLVNELLLMRDQSMCCYGAVPKINEWVSVKLPNGVKPVMDAPVTIYGKFAVGEMRENGYLVGLYQMTGDRMKE